MDVCVTMDMGAKNTGFIVLTWTLGAAIILTTKLIDCRTYSTKGSSFFKTCAGEGVSANEAGWPPWDAWLTYLGWQETALSRLRGLEGRFDDEHQWPGQGS